MTNKEKAIIILVGLDNFINVNWNMEEYYLKGIIKGLEEVEKMEKEEVLECQN